MLCEIELHSCGGWNFFYNECDKWVITFLWSLPTSFEDLHYCHGDVTVFLGYCIAGLQLVISESSTKVFSSPVYEVKKGSPSFHIRLDQCIPLQGDIKVEFFNKPKMMRRVSYPKPLLILYTVLRLFGE